MKMILKSAGLILLALTMLFAAGCASRTIAPLVIDRAPEETEDEKLQRSVKYSGLGVYEPEGFIFSGRVFMVGDSTMDGTYGAHHADGWDLMGWGYYLSYYLTPENEKTEVTDGVRVYNYAFSGASTRSYVESEIYGTLMRVLTKGDYLLIQLGHNDQGEHSDKTSSAEVSRQEVDETGKNSEGVYSYEWMLYEKYIKPALEAGALPILISPTTRMNVVDGSPIATPHMPYRDVMESLCKEFNLPFVDLTNLSVSYYQQVFKQGGGDAVRLLHAFVDEEHTAVDQSHLSHYGAFTIAGLVAKQLDKTQIALKNFVIKPAEYVPPRADS